MINIARYAILNQSTGIWVRFSSWSVSDCFRIGTGVERPLYNQDKPLRIFSAGSNKAARAVIEIVAKGQSANQKSKTEQVAT